MGTDPSTHGRPTLIWRRVALKERGVGGPGLGAVTCANRDARQLCVPPLIAIIIDIPPTIYLYE